MFVAGFAWFAPATFGITQGDIQTALREARRIIAKQSKKE
jgi:hypothetical protein